MCCYFCIETDLCSAQQTAGRVVCLCVRCSALECVRMCVCVLCVVLRGPRLVSSSMCSRLSRAPRLIADHHECIIDANPIIRLYVYSTRSCKHTIRGGCKSYRSYIPGVGVYIPCVCYRLSTRPIDRTYSAERGDTRSDAPFSVHE